MGVQSLWTLLEPCGRRVNIEALTNKRLAVGMVPHQYSNLAPLQQPDYVRGLLGVLCVFTSSVPGQNVSTLQYSTYWCANIVTPNLPLPCADASIWIFQFMQTMRDSRGEMLRNAHILGFFRRICRCANLC